MWLIYLSLQTDSIGVLHVVSSHVETVVLLSRVEGK